MNTVNAEWDHIHSSGILSKERSGKDKVDQGNQTHPTFTAHKNLFTKRQQGCRKVIWGERVRHVRDKEIDVRSFHYYYYLLQQNIPYQ